MGAHIDGFISVAAHTLVVGTKPDNKVKGRRADVILAAYYSSQAALRLLKNDKGVSKKILTISIKLKIFHYILLII